MIKPAGACLALLLILATASTMPTEARHHSKATCSTKSKDNSPASHFSGKWTGTLSGNDPHVNAVLVLNNCGDKYSGSLLWVSDKSGTCKRAVSGTYDEKTKSCILKDDRIISSKPKKPFVFGLIKKYDLQLGSDSVTLSGSYEAPSCKDFGSLDLSKPKTPPKK
jgi:hypothetical protein